MSYGYPQPPGVAPVPGPPAKPPMIGWDVTISSIALVLAAVIGGVAGFMGIFLLAFLDDCPKETCSVEGAFGAVAAGLGSAFVVGLLGGVWVIVRIGRRRISWPISAVTLVLVTGLCVAGVVGYFAAVGAWD